MNEKPDHLNFINPSVQTTFLEAVLEATASRLHDNLGQLLTSMRIMLNLAEGNAETSTEHIISANNTLTTALEELQSIMQSINHDNLYQVNIIQYINQQLNKFNLPALHISPPDINELHFKPDHTKALLFIVHNIFSILHHRTVTDQPVLSLTLNENKVSLIVRHALPLKNPIPIAYADFFQSTLPYVLQLNGAISNSEGLDDFFITIEIPYCYARE